MAQVSWDTSFAPPTRRRQEYPKPNESPSRHLNLEQASTLLDTTSCPRGTGQGDAKAQSVLHSKVKPPLKPRTRLTTRFPTRDGLALTTKRADPSYRTHGAQLGKGLIMWLIPWGLFLVKRASPLMKGPTVSFRPQPPRTRGAAYLFSSPDLCAGEEENTGSKITGLPEQFILAKRSQEAPFSVYPLNNQKRAKAALLRDLPHLS